MGREGEGWSKKKAVISISMYNVEGVRGGLYNMEKTSSDFTASYYTDGQ